MFYFVLYSFKLEFL